TLLLCFFFQAEDGIRDDLVTGVQTCALPIFTGTRVINEGADGRREFVFVPGPVFAHILLADEINRATPKTQSALLEAMAEQQVTVAGTSYSLAPPFFVLATLNPIEMDGTYAP